MLRRFATRPLRSSGAQRLPEGKAAKGKRACSYLRDHESRSEVFQQ